ncbi:molybdate ABC transporter permease subunit [Nodosilinea sp. PGN35]|uniref:molybdate ABC transporter permease subunit n=1 Tax=Nodosilinea sp. PGN35 TaxID=3020489 RepID=UPI0023B233DF|nr:molybdate ABC transporter permease subunit [Nodosilinea sp. TSF1-S3]MDF0366267.1 molybdate ABC transporter permease subunit [Nodosilinea sp. TSF1-S3]
MALELSPLWISLKVAGLATVVAFFSGLAAAYWMLGYRGPGKSLIEGVLVAPLVLPPTVVGFLLLLVLGRSGPLGQGLRSLGINLIFTWYGAVIAATVVAFPLMYRTTLGAFEQIDPTLIQVARTLGAREGRIFWRILLPLSVPGLLAGLTLAFARALGEFGATLMVAGNIPGRTQTMPMAIYFAVEAGAMNEAWLWVAIILMVSLSGIVGANLWQAQRHCRANTVLPETGRDLAQPSLGGDGVKRPWALAPQTVYPAAQKAAFLPPGLELTPAPPPFPRSSVPPSLHVTIYKPLATFPLEVSFEVGAEPLGILGASGSGKSMTLRCIAGVETPASGRIVLNNRVLFDSEAGINLPSHRRRVGLLFQTYALFPHLTVAENIGFGLQDLPRGERMQRVSGWLATMQLQGLGDRYPDQISGGQQQRVAFARALAIAPEVLLLDEPLSALDTYLRSQVEQQLIETLAGYGGVTLFVTHNLEEVFRVCPQIMVMAAGQPVASGTKHAVFERPGSAIAAQITGCKNFSRATRLSPTTIQAEDWNCVLEVVEPIPPGLSQVGFRAHHIAFVKTPQLPNTFPGWVVSTSETPHRVTLFLKLNGRPERADGLEPRANYHLQAELPKELWQTWKQQPMPWYVHLAPERVLCWSVTE